MGKAAKRVEIAWERFRALWEADPKMSLGEVAVMAKCTRQAVHRRAKIDGWRKVDTSAELAQKAHDQADSALVRTPLANTAGDPPGVSEQVASVAEDASVALRAKVLERHRREWDGARNLVYQAIREKDLEKGRLGRVAVESLKTIQAGERLAWGLDSGDNKPPATIIIERE